MAIRRTKAERERHAAAREDDRRMTKTRVLDDVLNELTTAVQKTEFGLVLHYSNDHDGWQVALGNAEGDERWKDAGTPQRLVDTLQEVVC